jgi:hypothetical protein
MIISRREWEEKCDSNRALLKDKAEKTELKHKDNIIDIQKQSIKTYKNDNDILMTANQKLTDWVNKIINEVGIYEVEDRRTVTIPICKNPRRVIAGKWDDIKDGMPEFLSQEEIIIPEIRFIRMK